MRGQGLVAGYHEAVARPHDAHDASGRFGKGKSVAHRWARRAALIDCHNLFRRFEAYRVRRKLFLLPSGIKSRPRLCCCGRARIALLGLFELLAGGFKLLLGQLAIAVRIRFRKTLEHFRQSRFGELLSLCICERRGCRQGEDRKEQD